MRWNLALLVVFALLALVRQVAAWEEGDFEIFDLVDALEKAEGPEVNFYTWMGATPKSSKPEVEKAFRKMSRALHPDKNKGPKAHEKYSRLSSIITILRDDYKRERYNFFLKNGVPRWRGSAYLYRRHRPGFKSVVVFLFILISGFQYLGRFVGYVQERRRMSSMIEQYKEMMREKHQRALDGPLTGRQRRSGVTAEEAAAPLIEDSPMYAVNQYGEEIELTLDNIHLSQAEADAKRKVRKAELAKKRAAKRAQRKNSPNVSDDDEVDISGEEEDEEALAAQAKNEELAAARRRRRMKAPGQASLKGGRRG
ncbi:MAG: hypothetical protein J3Q66DRAFT_182497 [Benniella sp.]|nr:MAG: hypothetical protein J3Q66DRAFT_182497 [Benniella sp.]